MDGNAKLEQKSKDPGMINLPTTYHKSASLLRMSPSLAGILLFVIRGYLSINYTFTATMR